MKTNGNAKLDWDIVAEIRQNAIGNGGSLSFKMMGEKYGVDKMAISRIVNNKAWHDPNYEAPSVKQRKLSPRQRMLECVIW
jgi:hypothetical protein